MGYGWRQEDLRPVLFKVLLQNVEEKRSAWNGDIFSVTQIGEVPGRIQVVLLTNCFIKPEKILPSNTWEHGLEADLPALTRGRGRARRRAV